MRLVFFMPLSKKTLDLLQLKHNIKFTDEHISFLNIVYSKRIRQRWPLHGFEWAVSMALRLYPAPDQYPEFVSPPLFEQIKLESFDDFMR